MPAKKATFHGCCRTTAYLDTPDHIATVLTIVLHAGFESPRHFRNNCTCNDAPLEMGGFRMVKAASKPRKSTGIFRPATAFVWSLVCFVGGVVASPYILQAYVERLPGPTFDSRLRGEILSEVGRPTCHFYLLTIGTFGEADYLNLEMQFPDTVTDFRVGTPQEVVDDDANHSGSMKWGKGWNSTGTKCIVQPDQSFGDAMEVKHETNGNIIRIATERLPNQSNIVALVATTETAGLAFPKPHFWYSGEYQYSRLGQSITRQLTFKTRGNLQ